MANALILTTSVLAFVWAGLLLYAAVTHSRIRALETVSDDSATVGDFPKVSVIVAARNEEERIGQCVESLLRQKYPQLEIIVVDDNSTDGTPEILASLSNRGGERLRVIRLDAPVEGWLGKCFALQQGARLATGDFILFTDADVIFEPPAISKAVALAMSEQADMVCVFPKLELKSLGERLFALGFVQLFFFAFNAHRAENRRSRAFVGVGAFNMVRRTLYEKIGGHSLLRLTVVDDVALGKLIKYAGGTVRVAWSDGLVRVRWQKGLRGSIVGVEKNAFAGLRYSWLRMLGAVGGVMTLWWGPWLMLCIQETFLGRTFAFLSLLCQLACGWGAAASLGLPPNYAVLSPVGVSLCCFALLRSAVLTSLRGGISWRGRFYALHDLKKYDKLS
jgi:ABC-type multidrug transport system fused ATPase/permease subunit